MSMPWAASSSLSLTLTLASFKKMYTQLPLSLSNWKAGEWNIQILSLSSAATCHTSAYWDICRTHWSAALWHHGNCLGFLWGHLLTCPAILQGQDSRLSLAHWLSIGHRKHAWSTSFPNCSPLLCFRFLPLGCSQWWLINCWPK